MHLIYKGDYSGCRPTWLSKHCAASRQRLAGRSSKPHLSLAHIHVHTNTHTHSQTHPLTHKPQVYPHQTRPVFPTEKQNKGSWGKQWTWLESLFPFLGLIQQNWAQPLHTSYDLRRARMKSMKLIILCLSSPVTLGHTSLQKRSFQPYLGD